MSMIKNSLKSILLDGPPFGKPFGPAFGRAFGGHEDFKPTDIGNLVIWLDAGVGVATDVSTWKDRSINGNNAAQGDSGKRPAFNATGINGFPSLTFDGTDDQMDVTSSTSLNFTKSFTAYVVNKCSDFSSFPTMFGKSGNDFRFLYDSDRKARGILGTGTGKDVTSLTETDFNQPIILELIWDVENDGLVEFTKDGERLGAAQFSTVGTITRNTDPFIVGQGGDDIQFFDGQIGQVLIFDKLLTLEERNQVGNYLASKYHLPWTDIAPNPDDVPGLVLWLDAARGIIDSGSPNFDVSSWVDQSGNENNAFQGTAGKKPTFKPTDFNGFPTLLFNESSDQNMEIDDDSTINLNSSFTYYVVTRSERVSSAIRYLMARNSPNGYEIFFDGANPSILNVGVKDILSFEVTSSTVAPTDNTDIILEVHYEVGGLVTFTQNGVLLGKVQSNSRLSINQSSTPLFIGSKDGGTSPFEGEMAQVLLFNRLLDLNERNFIGNYLADRYNLTWTDIKPFTPKDFGGLVAWYDAAEGITQDFNFNVSDWADQSGLGNDAKQNLGFERPLFREVSSGLNNRESLQFIEGLNLVAPANSSFDFTGSFSFFVVANLRFGISPPDNMTFFSKNGNDGYRWAITNANLPQIIASASTGSPQTITGSVIPEKIALILDVNFQVGGANRVKMSQNGRDIGNFINALANIDGTTAVFNIGGFTNADFDGLIGQILVYNNLLSTPERNAVGNYFANRYLPQVWQNISTAFVPTDIPGLALWLDANKGIKKFPEGSVFEWADQSGNGFVATQGVTERSPTFQPAAGNGHGALDWFPGQNQFLTMPVAQNSILDLQTDFTFYVVAELNDHMAIRTLLSRNPIDGYEFRVGTSGSLATFINDGGGAELDESAVAVPTFSLQIWEIHYDVGSTINFTQNGVALGSAQANTLTGITSNAASMIIGNDGGLGPESWEGGISQFIIYNRLLTTEERNQVGLYLSGRYLIPWTIIT